MEADGGGGSGVGGGGHVAYQPGNNTRQAVTGPICAAGYVSLSLFLSLYFSVCRPSGGGVRGEGDAARAHAPRIDSERIISV